MLDGYLKLADTEIINHARLQAYIDAGLVTGYEHIEACGCPSLTARSLSPCCLDVSDGAHASTPDDASFAVGFKPIDVNVTVRNVDDASDQVLASQWNEPNDRGWLLVLRSDGLLSFRASEDGTATTVNAVSTEPVPSREFTSYRARFEPVGPNFMELDGAGDYASTPDHASLDITGDIALVAYDIALDDWANGAGQTFIAKYGTTGGQRSYRLGVTAVGILRFELSADGVVGTAVTSDAVVPVADGVNAPGLAVVWRQSDGRVQFFTYDGMTWSVFGTDKTIAIASIFPGSASLGVGARLAADGDFAAGKFGRVEVRDGATVPTDGTVVTNPNFSAQAPGTTSFVDSTGKTYTLNGNAEIVPTGWRTTFYTRPTLSNFWLPLGASVDGTPGISVFNSTAPVRIGAAG